MNDRLQINGLAWRGRHGALAHEQQQAQRFEVDVELCFDQREASARDDLEATVDVRGVAGVARKVIEGPCCRLVETLAQRVADGVLALDRRIETVTVRLRKPQAQGEGGGLHGYQVTITRNRPGP